MLTQLASPFLGWIVDKYSARVAFYLMTTLTWTGLALMMISINDVDWLLYLAFSLISLNTWFGGLLTVQTGLYFQGHARSRVIFALNALFDAGAITYLGLWAIDSKLGNFTLLLGLYFILSVIVYGLGVYFWTVAVPEQAPADCTIHSESMLIEVSSDRRQLVEAQIMAASDNEHGPNETKEEECSELGSCEKIPSSGGSPTPSPENVRDDNTPNMQVAASSTPADTNSVESATNTFTPIHDRKPREQLMSEPYLMVVIYFVIHVVANQFNLATARDFLAYLGDDEYGNKYLTIFTLLTPASICGVPLVDRVLLRYGFHFAFQVINLLALTYQVVKVSSDNLNVQIVGFVVFSFFRSFFFGITFSFLPTLLSSDVVGKATGIMFAGAAVFSFVNIPLANLAVERLDGNFFAPNLVHTVLVAPCIIVAWRLGIYLNKVKVQENGVTPT